MSESADNAETEVASRVELDPARVRELSDAGEAELIDVRRGYEFEEGHLPDARRIEVNELTGQAGSIPKDRPVVFYCRTGNRSGLAATAFREAGYDAHNMAGGITAWVEAGYELEPEGGRVVEPRPPSAEER